MQASLALPLSGSHGTAPLLTNWLSMVPSKPCLNRDAIMTSSYFHPSNLVPQTTGGLAVTPPRLPSIQAIKETLTFLPHSPLRVSNPSTPVAEERNPSSPILTLPPLRSLIPCSPSPQSSLDRMLPSFQPTTTPPADYHRRSHHSQLPTTVSCSSPSPPPFHRSFSGHNSSSSGISSCPPTSPPSPLSSPYTARETEEEKNYEDRDSGKEDSESNSSCTTVEDNRKTAPVYTGVSRSGLNGRYRAQLSTKGKTVHLGTFSTAEEAARAWDRAAVAERGRDVLTNFDSSDYFESDGTLRKDVCGANKKENDEDRGKSKEYRGVYHSGTYGRWKARIVINGHKIHLGTFGTAADAARAWDRKAIEHRGSGTVTNFDASEYEREMAAFKAKGSTADDEGSEAGGDEGGARGKGEEDGEDTGSCGYRGIYSRSGSGKWVARLRNNKKSVYIGSYPTARQAAQAWDLAALRERGLLTATNFDKSNYLDANGNLITSLRFENDNETDDVSSPSNGKRKTPTSASAPSTPYSSSSSPHHAEGSNKRRAYMHSSDSNDMINASKSLNMLDASGMPRAGEEAAFADALLLLSRKSSQTNKETHN